MICDFHFKWSRFCFFHIFKCILERMFMQRICTFICQIVFQCDILACLSTSFNHKSLFSREWIFYCARKNIQKITIVYILPMFFQYSLQFWSYIFRSYIYAFSILFTPNYIFLDNMMFILEWKIVIQSRKIKWNMKD